MQFAIFDFKTPIAEAHRLEKGALAATQTREPLILIAVDMMIAEEELFASQGRRGGGSWKHIKPETAARKGSQLILIESGQLKDSLTKIGARFQILRIGNSEIEFGTDKPGADALHGGTKDGRLPARPLLRFTPGDVNRWIITIGEHLMRPHR